MTTESAILKILSGRPAGLTLGELEAAMKQQGSAPFPGALECMLRLSPKFSCNADRWLRKTDSKAAAVIAAFDRHVQTTGRRLFKADTALASLPIASKPTAEELLSISTETNSFEVLKNGMINYRA